jgi:hypothetical protein
MTNPKLMETADRLEKVVLELIDKDLVSSDLYSTYEIVAIQVLDSEFDDYPEDELGQYLKDFLETVRKEQ